MSLVENPANTIGQKVTERSAEDWATALESEDIAEVLAVLTRIKRNHMYDQSKPGLQEQIKARLNNEINLSKTEQSKIKKLMQSDNLWIQEASKQFKIVTP